MPPTPETAPLPADGNEYVKAEPLPALAAKPAAPAAPLQVHKCVVCGKAWTSAQSYRAHMRSHHRQGYVRTSIVVQDGDWKAFKELCEKHNSTTCHVMGALIQAAIAGEKQGVITLASPNPVFIQVNHYFSAKPRSLYKAPLNAPVPGCCPECGVPVPMSKDGTLKVGRCAACGAELLVDPGKRSSAP